MIFFLNWDQTVIYVITVKPHPSPLPINSSLPQSLKNIYFPDFKADCDYTAAGNKLVKRKHSLTHL